MKLGVVGLPNVGKSTLFNAMTKAGAEAMNYPFCTIDPNVGVAVVPDKRLDVLAGIYSPEKYTPAVIEFVDIAGLVKGAYRGEGLGNRFLAHIREVDAIVHVVRCFEDDNVTHVDGSVDPVRDMETINLELLFADMDTVDKRRDRALKSSKSGEKRFLAEAEALTAIYDWLESGRPARAMEMTELEKELAKEMWLLSAKPVIYAANVDEAHISGGAPGVDALMAEAAAEGAEVIVICAAIEADLAELDDEERTAFMEELGIDKSGLDKLITACYSLLGLISFLTAGPKEVRAWTIEKGTRAPQAAGKIHTDFERGFIRAEVVPYAALAEYRDMSVCREKGLVRSEGKDYVMQDGDVVVFRFNV